MEDLPPNHYDTPDKGAQTGGAMPEIPELETIARVFNDRIQGQRIAGAVVRIPVVVRRPPVPEFIALLTGNRAGKTTRYGKYVLLTLESGHVLAINLMLTSRLQLVHEKTRLPGRTSWVITFEGGDELRFFGERLDGRVYLVGINELSLIPQFGAMGPDALDPALTFDVFRQRLRKFPGQIKNSLVSGKLVAGIGNAYVDELLWEARVYPFAPGRELTPEQVRALYDAIGKTYAWAVPTAAAEMGEAIETKVRDFLRVHRKGGQPCPRCGNTITEVTPNQRITSYCRHCQGAGRLIDGKTTALHS